MKSTKMEIEGSNIPESLEDNKPQERKPLIEVIKKQLNDNIDITNEEKELLTVLIEEYKDVMAAGFDDNHPAGSSFFIPHKIKLPLYLKNQF